MALGSVGFNYALSPHDTVGILYRFAGFHYDGEPRRSAPKPSILSITRKSPRKWPGVCLAGRKLHRFACP